MVVVDHRGLLTLNFGKVLRASLGGRFKCSGSWRGKWVCCEAVSCFVVVLSGRALESVWSFGPERAAVCPGSEEDLIILTLPRKSV